jgi:hypothetical protein
MELLGKLIVAKMWGGYHRKDHPKKINRRRGLVEVELQTMILHFVRPVRQLVIAVDKVGAKMCARGGLENET